MVPEQWQPKPVVTNPNAKCPANVAVSSCRNDGLTGNLLFLVFIVTFGTWFSLGYNIVALNGPQLIIVKWIRTIKCSRLDNQTSVAITIQEFPRNWSYTTAAPSRTNVSSVIKTSKSAAMNPSIRMTNYSTENRSLFDIWCQPLDPTVEEEVALILDQNPVLNSLWAMTSALFSLGGLVSAFTSGPMIRRYGLKMAILINAMILAAGTVVGCLSTLANSYEMLIAGRIFVGFAVGSGCVLTPMYTAELTPVALRGALGTMPTTMFVLGMISATVVGLPFALGNGAWWPILLALHLVPVGLMGIVLPFCPESPRHLLARRKDMAAATRALTWLRGTSNVQEELAIMQVRFKMRTGLSSRMTCRSSI